MVVKQFFNKKIDAWVKIKVQGKKTKVLNVKQRNPQVPFKGVKKG